MSPVNTARVRNVGDHIAARVGRPELEQLDSAPGNVQGQRPGKGPGWQAHVDAVELKGPERVAHEGAQVFVEVRLLERMHQRCRYFLHVLHGRLRGHDLGLLWHELVAVAVVSVAMRVEHLPDRAPVGVRPPRIEHLPREPQVEQRVDQQRAVLGDDQAGVTPTPSAIRLQEREQALAEFVQPARVGALAAHRRILNRAAPGWRPQSSRGA
jgi:hypothetical protein